MYVYVLFPVYHTRIRSHTQILLHRVPSSQIYDKPRLKQLCLVLKPIKSCTYSILYMIPVHMCIYHLSSLERLKYDYYKIGLSQVNQFTFPFIYLPLHRSLWGRLVPLPPVACPCHSDSGSSVSHTQWQQIRCRSLVHQ